MTRTITSNAPGSGTSISSSWKASVGSPSRSSRITQAAIVAGSVPGSTSSSETFVTSTAMLGIGPLGSLVAAGIVSGADRIGPMRAKVYGIPGSHPVRACPPDARPQGDRLQAGPGAERGLPADAAGDGLPGRDRARASSSTGASSRPRCAISRALDEIRPDPPLFPADPEPARARRGGRALGRRGAPAGARAASPTRRRSARAPAADIASFFEGPLLGMPPEGRRGDRGAAAGGGLAPEQRVRRRGQARPAPPCPSTSTGWTP